MEERRATEGEAGMSTADAPSSQVTHVLRTPSLMPQFILRAYFMFKL